MTDVTVSNKHFHGWWDPTTRPELLFSVKANTRSYTFMCIWVKNDLTDMCFLKGLARALQMDHKALFRTDPALWAHCKNSSWFFMITFTDFRTCSLLVQVWTSRCPCPMACSRWKLEKCTFFLLIHNVGWFLVCFFKQQVIPRSNYRYISKN